MLSRAELIDIFDQLGTPLKGRELIQKARVDAPIRDVASRGGNVITHYVSRKMGREIATESRHIEFAAAVDKEYDPAVLEYYAQPCLIRLQLNDLAAGKVHSIQHTPDFLTITANGITLEEWKSIAKLARLAEKYPYRYQQDSDRCWRAPQIEEQLAELGIHYRVRAGEEIPQKRIENYLHLADYMHPSAEPCPSVVVSRLNDLLEVHGSIYISELLNEPHRFLADDINKAIADNLVVVDLNRESLTQPNRSRLYRDETLREFLAANVKSDVSFGNEKFILDISVGKKIHYEKNLLTISLVGERTVVFTNELGQTIELEKVWLENAFNEGRVVSDSPSQSVSLDLTKYSKRDLDIALKRHAILNSDSKSSDVSERSLRRWKQFQMAVVVQGGNEIIGLAPKISARGNRTARLDESQISTCNEIIETTWRSHKSMSYKACYRILHAACDAAGIRTPSYPTFANRIKSQMSHHDNLVRDGKRMAYQKSEFVFVLYEDTPIHGSRPFQYVHIDHTQSDVELISARTGKSLGRPWLTFAICARTRRIVGLYLTFDPPSYVSVMMVLRDMVRRFSRLPEFVVLDNGADFLSNALASFLQTMQVNIRRRPAGRPRHGAVIERIFGKLHAEYIHQLAGNTKATKNVRMVTGKHLPVNFAEWTLEALYFGISYWAFDFYDQERHTALDCSPREMFQRDLRLSGKRPQRNIFCNKDFLIATCPPVDRGGIRKVDPQRGVKVNNMHYWHPELRDARNIGKKFPVRYDPWDASSVYVRVKDHWLQATCRNLIGLGQLTEYERRAVTEEYTHRSGEPGDKLLSAQRLREFMQVFTPEGALATAIDRQGENKALYRQLEIAEISPVAPRYKTSLQEHATEVDVSRDADIESVSSICRQDVVANDQLPDYDTY